MPFSPIRRPVTFLLPGLVAVLALASAAAVGGTGCGDNSTVSCDTAGDCQICDALGCRPAKGASSSSTGSTSNGSSSGGGMGGGSTSSSSASSTSSSSGDAGTGGAGGNDGGTTDGGTTDAGDAAPPPCDPQVEACPCPATGPCPSPESCVEGLCVVGCNYTYQCGAGKVCANGACVPGCSATMPCATGYTCAHGACEPDPFNPQCGPKTPCPSAQICVGGLCTTGCTATSQCGAGEICDGATNACIPDPSPKPACDTSHPCPSPEVCLADGYCHYPCTTVHDCQIIDNRLVACSSGYCETAAEENPECTLDVPCPSGESCVSNACY